MQPSAYARGYQNSDQRTVELFNWVPRTIGIGHMVAPMQARSSVASVCPGTTC
jgi:hypothetical protein